MMSKFDIYRTHQLNQKIRNLPRRGFALACTCIYCIVNCSTVTDIRSTMNMNCVHDIMHMYQTMQPDLNISHIPCEFAYVGCRYEQYIYCHNAEQP